MARELVAHGCGEVAVVVEDRAELRLLRAGLAVDLLADEADHAAEAVDIARFSERRGCASDRLVAFAMRARADDERRIVADTKAHIIGTLFPVQ